MRHDKLVPGTILISLGVIFLLQSFGVIHIHFWNIVHLWPVFIVIAGINLIFANNRSPLATSLKIGVVILGLLILVFGQFDRDRGWRSIPHFSYRNDDNKDDDGFDFNIDDDDDNTDVATKAGQSQFNEPLTANTQIAKLNISGGGTSYNLSDTTGQLFEAVTKRHLINYMLTHTTQDSLHILNFRLANGKGHFNFGKKSETVTFKLNSTPIWDFDIQTGATEMNFDLSKFKVRNLDLNGGAAAFKLKLGQPLETTRIDVSTGAASVHIAIPNDAACKITTDSGLSSKDFKGFTKITDDHYETPGFANAKNKILIQFDGGVSDFTVTRY